MQAVEGGQAAKAEREHYWDIIRGALLLLGLPYHAALIYASDSDWAVHSQETSGVLTFMCAVLHSFRMPVFFMLAGYFSYMLLRRRGASVWLRGRMVRLGLPLVTAALLLNAIQMIATARAEAITGAIARTQISAVIRAQITSPGSQWISHLWFLMALIVYAALLALCFPLVRRTVEMPYENSLSDRLLARPYWLLATMIAMTAAWLLGTEAFFVVLNRMNIRQPLGGMLSIEPIMGHLPFFALGVIAQAAPRAHRVFRSAGPYAITVAFLFTLLCGWTGMQHGFAFRVAGSVLTAVTGVLMACALITLAARIFQRQNAAVTRIVDASFSIYLFHHPIILVLGTIFLRISLPPIVEFLVITTVTLIVSYGAHQLIRRSSILLLAFNGVEPKRRTSGQASAPAIK